MDRTVKIDPIIKTEPTVKIILALIAVGLFANLLRPALTPAPAQAAPVPVKATPLVEPQVGSVPALSYSSGEILVVQDGRLYVFQDMGMGKRPRLYTTREISTKQ